jgi:hypothetical protein
MGSYQGTYAVNTNMVNQCLVGPVVTLDYPGVTPKSSLTLSLNSPLCPGTSATFKISGGTGLFANANGSGGVTYSDPSTFNFNDTTGNFFNRQTGPNLGTTPELDSLLLFGTGALGMAGYGLTRLRAGRKQRSA